MWGLKSSLSASTEHSSKEKAKERDREEKEKKKFKEREEKKKHKVVNDIKRENGDVKQPIKGWWKHTRLTRLRESHESLPWRTSVRKRIQYRAKEAPSPREEVLGRRI